MFNMAGPMGDMFTFEELMDNSGRKMSERMQKEGKLHYDVLSVQDRINFKALIMLDKAYTSSMSHRMDKTEFEILQMMHKLNPNWRVTINIMLDKWQNIINKEEENDKSNK